MNCDDQSGPDFDDDLKAFGVIVNKKDSGASELFVFEENMDAIQVFLAMSTQWIVGGMGSIVGLNYLCLEFVMKTLRVKKKQDCFFRIRIMEKEFLKQMRKENSNGSTA